MVKTEHPFTTIDSLQPIQNSTLRFQLGYTLVDRGDPEKVALVILWQAGHRTSGQGKQRWTGQNLKLLVSEISKSARNDITRLKSGL
jgi:hypothetical protein